MVRAEESPEEGKMFKRGDYVIVSQSFPTNNGERMDQVRAKVAEVMESGILRLFSADLRNSGTEFLAVPEICEREVEAEEVFLRHKFGLVAFGG